MVIDEKTKNVLIDKLQFSPLHISRLENDAELLSKTLGLLEMFKRSPRKQEVKVFVLAQLKKIRQLLNKPPFSNNSLLLEKRSEYYTFQKATKWSFLSRFRRVS